MSQETYYPREVEFEASFSLETNHIPDFYHYYFVDGTLYSYVTCEPVEKDILRRDIIEELEYQAFRKIQSRLGERDEGMAVWISSQGPYKESKIIFSDIVYEWGVKKLRNRSVCLSWNSQDCLKFARSLGFREGELRANPIFIEPHISVADILQPYDPRQARLIRENEDFEIKERLKAQIAQGNRAPIGPYRDSCGRMPTSAFNLIYGDSLNMGERWSYHSGTCRLCGESTAVGPCNICKVCEKKF